MSLCRFFDRCECVSPCDLRCTLDTEKRIAGFLAPVVHGFGDLIGNLKHLVAFVALKPCCRCCHWNSPLCVACVAYPVEQFTRHIEKDVNIDGAVECLDGASDFLT